MTNFNNQKEEKRKILYGLELAYEKLLQFKKRKKQRSCRFKRE